MQSRLNGGLDMKDSEMLDWVQSNMVNLHMDLNERFTMEWINNSGIHCQTRGVNLRDCIRGAIAGEYELIDA
jgi:hypothetical protein